MRYRVKFVRTVTSWYWAVFDTKYSAIYTTHHGDHAEDAALNTAENMNGYGYPNARERKNE